MGLVQKASSELEFAKTKKDVLRKSLEHIQAQSVSILSLTLDWKDLEAHLDSVQQSILQRAEEVEWKEKRLVERSEIAGLREKELESAQNSFHDRVRQIELKEEEVDKFQKSVEKLFQEVEIARKLVEDCSKEVERKEKEVADRLHEIESKEKEIERRQRAVELKEGNVENLQNSVEEPSKQVELKVKESKNSVENSIEKSSKEPEPKKKRKVLVRTTTKGGEKKQQTIQDCWKEVEQREKEVAQRFKEIELKEKEVEQRQKAAELKEADIESLQKSVEERSKQVEKRFKLIKKFENLVQSRKKLTTTPASTPDSNAQPKKGLVRPPILRPPDSGTQLVEPLLCEVCNIKCFYQHEVDTHLAGKKHQSWLDNFSPYQAIPGLMTLEPLSLTFPNAPPAPSIPQQDDKLPCTLPQAEASLPVPETQMQDGTKHQSKLKNLAPSQAIPGLTPLKADSQTFPYAPFKLRQTENDMEEGELASDVDMEEVELAPDVAKDDEIVETRQGSVDPAGVKDEANSC